PEQRHDAVAHHLVHGALVPVHRLDHAFQHRIQELARLLGIPVGEQLHRALEVSEEHGHLLAFALKSRFRGEDLLGEVLGSVGLRGIKSLTWRWCGRYVGWVRAFGAELRDRRECTSAPTAGSGEGRGALLTELPTHLVVVLAARALHGSDPPVSLSA